ncbi:Hypothetical protein, putative [Bodo saltans]|uniref:Uncharacterized protein n=1 Tax=Bodo saltans TaxID=75058 RepID=A0A0S4KKG0_BODSA|nr:Hypothetical protein, putative [Bodo saltans]|eukprot:CUI14101.1 Hypothetical protein, putative [Bodo saltans]
MNRSRALHANVLRRAPRPACVAQSGPLLTYSGFMATQRRMMPALSLSALASAFEDIGLGQPSHSPMNATTAPREPPHHQNVLDLSSLAPTTQTMSSRHIQAHYEELYRAPLAQLMEELNAATLKGILDRSVVALYAFERRTRPGSSDELAITDFPHLAIHPILKLVSTIGITQIETSLAAELLAQHANGVHQPRWLASLIGSCMGYLVQNAHAFTFCENVQVLHLLCLCEDIFFEEVLSTMVDLIRLQIRPASPAVQIVVSGGETPPPRNTTAELLPSSEGIDLPSCSIETLSRTLTSAILLAETISSQTRQLLPLLVQPEHTNSTPGREKQFREMETVRLLHVLATADHPVVNQSLTTTVLLFIGSIFTEFRSRGQLQPMIAPQSWYFLLRSLGKLPWLPEAAVSAMLPSLHVALSHNSSICKGVLILLGREQVQSANAPLVLKVLEIHTNDLNQSIATRRRATSPHQRKLRCIEFTKLPTFLPLVHHMLKTNLKSLLPGRKKDAAQFGDDAAATIQTAAKAMYTALCDDLLDSTTSVNDLCQAKLVDQVLHHLVCQAPKSLVHHPFVHHLVFAMSQTLPSLRFVSEATQGRLLAVIERLQEEDILNDMCQMSFQLIRNYPMLISSLEATLEFKRKALLNRLREDPHHQSLSSFRGKKAELADLPPYKGNPELIENNCSIAFVALRRLVSRCRTE